MTVPFNKAWNQIEFRFKSPRSAERLHKFLKLGVDLELIPANTEIELNDDRVLVGYNSPRARRKTREESEADDPSGG